MGKLFDKLNKIGDYQTPIEKYLVSRGFYESTMRPRFMNGIGYDELDTDRACLRHDSDINDGETLRIFVNDKDIYFEVENSWRSYSISRRYSASEHQTVEDIDILLDGICERVIKHGY